MSDERVAWYDGKTLTGRANDLHGPYLGHDGWIYWTKGGFAEQRQTLGTGKQLISRASHIFRARPDGSGLETVLTGGMNNPVGLAFSATGERVLSGTFFQMGVPGTRDGLIHALYGGVYGKEDAVTAGFPRTGDLMPVMTHMGSAAPSGSTAYRSAAFGPDFADNLFVCYFNVRKISRHQLVADGGTFRTNDTDFLISDSPDFRPVDVLEDADGSLLVVDTGGWYKICCPTSQLSKPDILGGVYRIRKTGAPRIGDPRGLEIPWAAASLFDLAKLLADTRPYVVDRAMHALGRKGAPAVAAVVAHALKAPDAAARRHAIWTLSRIEHAAARAAVRSALADSDATVVQTALQVTSLHRDAAAFDTLVRLVASANAHHARLAAEALGRIGDVRAVDSLLSAARKLPDGKFTASGTPAAQGDRVLEHALIYALTELGQSAPLLALLEPATPPRVVRVALVALDQMPDSGLAASHVLPWLTSTVAQLKQTAGWIVPHRPDWGDALAGYYRERLKAPLSARTETEELQTQLAQLAQSQQVQALLVATAESDALPTDVRLLALRTIAANALKETPAAWFAAVAKVLAQGNPVLIRAAIGTARSLSLSRGGHPDLAESLGRVGRNAALPTDLRLDALAVLPASLGPIDDDLFAFLRAHLDAQHPMLLRSYAATALARAPLTGVQQLALADTMQTVGAIEAPKLLPAFERAPTDALGRRLLAALENSPARAGLRGSVLKPLFAKYPPAVQRQGATLIASLNSNAARENARVDELLVATKGGDIRRGQAMFNSEKTACMMCHSMGHRGGKLGPDLTKIGGIRSERELLEAIVFPSATFVRGYEPFNVTT